MSQSQSQPQFQSDAKSRSETVPLLGSKSSSDSKPQAEEDSKPPLDSKSRPRSDSKPRSPSKPQQMPLRPRSESKPQSRTQSPTKPHMSSDVRPVRDRRYDDMMSPRGSQRSLNSLNPYYSQSSSSHQRSRSAIMPGEMPGHYRSRSSLGPGDMAGPSSRSHEKRSSSSRRHQSHRGRGNRPLPDTIDTLDNSGFGPAYHHGGPYDATLATVNKHKKTSPLEAVKKSNLEALKATPREFIVDSLRKHVPLQGTATIPPGMPDFSGRIMDYEEGADLMREPDAAGGAYKRYDFLKYHPDDLKGKGEPSFTIERALKEGKSRRQRASFSYGSGAEYELQDRSRPPVSSNGRSSFSSGRPGTSEGRAMQTAFEAAGTSGTVQRSNSTSKRLSDGLKRRFGSLHRKDK